MDKISNIPEAITPKNAVVRSRNHIAGVKSRTLSTNYRTRGTFSNLNAGILAKYVFFFLELPDVCKSVVNVNANWNKAYKAHLNARIYVLSQETKMYEKVNIDLVESIRHKRMKYYSDYELELPRRYGSVEENDDESAQKSKAIQLLNAFTADDLSHLRRIRSYSEIYELFSAPLVILWDQKPERKVTADGRLHVSYWKTAFKILNDTQFLSKIRNYKLESISQKKFEGIERFICDEEFRIEKAEKINKSLASLVCWAKGVYLFHQYLREYSLSSIDQRIFTNTEKKFARLMDNLCFRNFKMLRYVQEHCSKEQVIIQDFIEGLKAEREVLDN